MAAPTHSETGTPKGGSSGLPQLNVDTFAGQLLWLAITFGFLYWVLSRIAIPKIATVLEERRDKIANDLDRAQQLRTQADEAIKAYETALAEARAAARAQGDDVRRKLAAEVDKKRAEAEARIAEELAKAEARIGAAKKTALQSVRSVASDAAVAIVAKLTGDQVGADAAQRAVDGAMQARA